MSDRNEREAALGNDDLAQFTDAVLVAFPDKELLYSVLLNRWGVRVSDIVYTEKPGKLVVSELVDWSHAQGRALDMLELIRDEMRSQLQPLETLAGRLLEPYSAAETAPPSVFKNANVSLASRHSPFESMSFDRLANTDGDEPSTQTQDLLTRLRGGLCIVANNGQGRSTGFLVGKRHVLTSFSAVRDLAGSPALGLRVLFDNGWGQQLSELALAGDAGWLATFSETGLAREEQARNLDFALLRLVAGASADRRVLPLPRAVPIAAPGETVFLPRFAQAQDLRISDGPLVMYSQAGFRVHYDIDCEPGSAGAPVVTSSGDLIAMHHAGIAQGSERALSQGVPVWRIRAAIAAAGIDPDDL